jgi:hypothetical protein
MSEESARPGASLVIVLSAYNGARYLAEQIESIRSQTWTDWTLVVRDDGSADGTVRLVEQLASADRRIQLYRDQRGNLGPVASFGALLEHAWIRGADYVALADQDDVWRPDKLERQIALLQEHEARAGRGRPALVHSDLAVVDAGLRPLHASFLAHQRLEHVGHDPLPRLLVQNFVTGCTVVLNRALLGVAIPVPPIVMHDWWLAQCAAALGSLLFLPAATVSYRQHARNVHGSPGALRLYRHALRRPGEWWGRGRRSLAAAGRQAGELAARLQALAEQGPVDPRALELVSRYHAVLRGPMGPLGRLREIRRLRVRPRSLFSPLFYLRIVAGLSGAEDPEPESESEPELWQGVHRA